MHGRVTLVNPLIFFPSIISKPRYRQNFPPSKDFAIRYTAELSWYNPSKQISYPPAGRLVHFQQNWLITQDRWVLNTIQGYLIDFSTSPHQSVILHCPHYSAEQTHLISEEITALLQKGAIGEIIPVEQTGFYSNFFLVPKKDGEQRQKSI